MPTPTCRLTRWPGLLLLVCALVVVAGCTSATSEERGQLDDLEFAGSEIVRAITGQDARLFIQFVDSDAIMGSFYDETMSRAGLREQAAPYRYVLLVRMGLAVTIFESYAREDLESEVEQTGQNSAELTLSLKEKPALVFSMSYDDDRWKVDSWRDYSCTDFVTDEHVEAMRQDFLEFLAEAKAQREVEAEAAAAAAEVRREAIEEEAAAARAEAQREAEAQAAETEAQAAAVDARTVTYEEYEAIKTGMSFAQVVDIIGWEGEEMSRVEIVGIVSFMQMWTNPGGMANMNVTFQNNRVVAKAQFGLE